MAIQAGMTVYDLEESELAYAPPFGAAKDPVNMAGFVAANELRGDVRTIHADELEGQFLVDVREPAEHAVGAIPGSTLIPLHTLRERHSDLPKDRRIVVYCKVGLRGYIAARILSQLGLDTANLSGGYTTYRLFHPSELGNPTDSSAPNGSAQAKPIASSQTPKTGATTSNSRAALAHEASQQTKEVSAVNGTPAQLLDVRGMQCPGPLVQVSKRVSALRSGEMIEVLASDPGFPIDIPAWCISTGNQLLDVEPIDGHYRARIRKGYPGPQASSANEVRDTTTKGQTIVVFSTDLDKVLAAFVIANGAASMGKPVTLFFTFWGLNVLRRPGPQSPGKNLVDRMFGWMMPKGAERLGISRMKLGGVGTLMLRKVMRNKGVESLPDLMNMAREQGVRLVACAMSMDVMGIRADEFIDGVEIGGVGAYLTETDRSSSNLFI